MCQDYSFLVSHGSLFPHPATGQAAYVVTDACHMLRLQGMYVKLIRFLVSHGSLFPHPANGQAAYVVTDACHMFSL